MKTTVNLSDHIFRRSKARAALLGQSFGSFLEEALTKALAEKETEGEAIEDWLSSLPKVPKGAADELHSLFNSDEFREVDPEMWR